MAKIFEPFRLLKSFQIVLKGRNNLTMGAAHRKNNHLPYKALKGCNKLIDNG